MLPKENEATLLTLMDFWQSANIGNDFWNLGEGRNSFHKLWKVQHKKCSEERAQCWTPIPNALEQSSKQQSWTRIQRLENAATNPRRPRTTNIQKIKVTIIHLQFLPINNMFREGYFLRTTKTAPQHTAPSVQTVNLTTELPVDRAEAEERSVVLCSFHWRNRPSIGNWKMTIR